VGQPALHPAAGRHRKVINAVGNPGGIHQIAGKNEKRHRQQWKAVEPARHPVQDDEIRNSGDEMRVEQ
jgi:hypothetical protein